MSDSHPTTTKEENKKENSTQEGTQASSGIGVWGEEVPDFLLFGSAQSKPSKPTKGSKKKKTKAGRKKINEEQKKPADLEENNTIENGVNHDPIPSSNLLKVYFYRSSYRRKDS
jgi:hypothetical protein